MCKSTKHRTIFLFSPSFIHYVYSWFIEYSFLKSLKKSLHKFNVNPYYTRSSISTLLIFMNFCLVVPFSKSAPMISALFEPFFEQRYVIIVGPKRALSEDQVFYHLHSKREILIIRDHVASERENLWIKVIFCALNRTP